MASLSSILVHFLLLVVNSCFGADGPITRQFKLHMQLYRVNPAEQEWKIVTCSFARKEQYHYVVRCVVENMYRQLTWINFCFVVALIFRGEFQIIFTQIKVGWKNSQNCKLPKEFAREKWGHFMAFNILKNNSFGGPTYFDRRWATYLGRRQEGRTGLAK